MKAKESFHFRAWYSLEEKISPWEEETYPLNNLESENQEKNTKILLEKTQPHYPSKENKSFFHTDCGHLVKVAKVKKVGGQMEGKYYAKISGPKINSKSGIKTIYFDKKEDAESAVNKFLYPSNNPISDTSTSNPEVGNPDWLTQALNDADN